MVIILGMISDIIVIFSKCPYLLEVYTEKSTNETIECLRFVGKQAFMWLCVAMCWKMKWMGIYKKQDWP